MADQNIREIQVSGKQLVFLFMASVVVAVAVFLLGVSVGRGVREAAPPAVASTAAAPPTEVPAAPAEMPPKTELSPGDLEYSKTLQGTGANPPMAAPGDAKAPSTPPAGTPDVDESAAVGSKKAPVTTPSAPAQAAAPSVPAPRPTRPAETAPAKTASTAPLPAPGKTGWVVQVNAFHSRENADRQAQELNGKGYPAFVLTAPPSGFYRVRVGPYPDRADADRVVQRLRQEGFQPSVTR
jgi:DedD protein